MVGTIGFVGGRAAHLRVPAGHRVQATEAERAEHLGALAACDGTHIRLARHEWGTVSEMSPPFRSACPDSTRLFLKDLPCAIRRVAPLYISPTKPPPAQAHAPLRAIPGKPFTPGRPVCGAIGATERLACWTYLGPEKPRRGSSRACRSSRGPCSRASQCARLN